MSDYVFVSDEEEQHGDSEPCPMGCGRITDDVYGGPCSLCWSDLYASRDDPRTIYSDDEDYPLAKP